MKSFVIFCFVLMFFAPAMSQELRESGEFNPIFDLYDTEQNAQSSTKDAYIKLKLDNVLSKDTDMRSFWQDEIRNRTGHFFMMETKHKLDNGYTLIFSHFRSNLTCANYGEYTKPNQGSENCFAKLIVISPDYYRTLQLNDIWMDGNNDLIYLKPEVGKELFINEMWYRYSKKDEKYVLSNGKN